MAEIIGVVGDSLNDGLNKPVAPAVYAPYTFVMPPFTQVLVRTQGEPLALLHTIRQQVASLDPDQQIFNDVPDLKAGSSASRNFSAGGSFLSSSEPSPFWRSPWPQLASSALSPTPSCNGQASSACVSHSERVAAMCCALSPIGRNQRGIGIAAGLALSLSLNRLIARWIESGTRDPWMILAVSLVLIAVAALACLIPARRATAIDPMAALRCE